MYSTYSAILRDQILEWAEEKPRSLVRDRAVHVHVTILDDALVAPPTDQGQRMAAALEKLARLESSTTPIDPAAWERETRADRTLPDRD
jgi:hypothetical protein